MPQTYLTKLPDYPIQKLSPYDYSTSTVRAGHAMQSTLPAAGEDDVSGQCPTLRMSGSWAADVVVAGEAALGDSTFFCGTTRQ
ncbi:hypothetical protein J6590_089682 [Homalodisca vitripennis]|nr:hypothetical protein J6590_089682 [Homalodisca vitripennis]